MKKISDYIFNFVQSLRCCVWCGSLFCRYETAFCEPCYQLLIEQHLSGDSRLLTFGNRQIQVHSLFDWVQDRSVLVSVLIKHLKAGGVPDVFDYYVGLLLKRRTLRLMTEHAGGVVVIPAPSCEENVKNHAYSLAKSAAKQCGWQLRSPLKKHNAAKQHGLSKSERARLEFSLDEEFTLEQFQNLKIIFIDDVVTTGATVRAAYIALGAPRDFEVWTIANRHQQARPETNNP